LKKKRVVQGRTQTTAATGRRRLSNEEYTEKGTLREIREPHKDPGSTIRTTGSKKMEDTKKVIRRNKKIENKRRKEKIVLYSRITFKD